jgi:hypothetical protein
MLPVLPMLPMLPVLPVLPICLLSCPSAYVKMCKRLLLNSTSTHCKSEKLCS